MAMTGALWDGNCFGAQSIATDAYYSSQGLVIAGSTAHRFQKSGVEWQVVSYTLEPGGLVYSGTQFAPLQIFPVCDPAEGFTDGLVIGWGIAAAVVAGAALIWLKRCAR